MANPPRLPRGTRVDPIATGYVIERASKLRLDAIAQRSKMSGSVLLEHMIDHLEEDLTDSGVPHWLPQPDPKDGELPIEKLR